MMDDGINVVINYLNHFYTFANQRGIPRNTPFLFFISHLTFCQHVISICDWVGAGAAHSQKWSKRRYLEKSQYR